MKNQFTENSSAYTLLLENIGYFPLKVRKYPNIVAKDFLVPVFERSGYKISTEMSIHIL